MTGMMRLNHKRIQNLRSKKLGAYRMEELLDNNSFLSPSEIPTADKLFPQYKIPMKVISIANGKERCLGLGGS